MYEHDSTPSREPEFFSDTLTAGRDRAPLRYVLSAPLGLTAHGLVLAGVVVMSMLALPEHDAPAVRSATLLQFAPPPPQTLLRGASLETESAIASEAVTSDSYPSFEIPDEILTARVSVSDVSAGFDHGFNDGHANGLTAGMPGGVVGGVPGGLVGGVIGGLGNELPEFPKPDVGPKPVRMPPASYSEAAIRQNVRGSVKLRVVITERGKVEVLEVLRSIPELDAEAIRTVESTWLFEPATKNGRPIPSLGDLVVRFNLY